MPYKELIKKLYTLDNNAQGYDAAEIVAVEERLGLHLPAVLKDYYLELGRNGSINLGHNRLLAPANIYITESGYLVFYEECQSIAIWGIAGKDLNEPDPKVYGCYDMGPEEWFEDSDTTAHFLLSMAYLQAGLGSLRYSASTDKIVPELLTTIEQTWKEQKGLTHQYLRFFTNDHRTIILLTTDAYGIASELYIASDDKTMFKDTASLIAAQWDHFNDL